MKEWHNFLEPSSLVTGIFHENGCLNEVLYDDFGLVHATLSHTISG
jgi:hypothetical protein